MRLTWETPGHLTLTHRDYDTVGATIQVPVTIDGQPPEIAFDPKYLADALEIGPTLRLVDKLNPGMATSPSGNFCVLMNQRFTEETTNGGSHERNTGTRHRRLNFGLPKGNADPALPPVLLRIDGRANGDDSGIALF